MCREVQEYQKAEKREGYPELVMEAQKEYWRQIADNRHRYIHTVAGGFYAFRVCHFKSP